MLYLRDTFVSHGLPQHYAAVERDGVGAAAIDQGLEHERVGDHELGELEGGGIGW